MSPEALATLLGLGAAVAWGSGDFSGGLASKRAAAYSVIFVSQIIGIAFLALLALVFGESLPPMGDLLLGGVAGLAAMVGLLGLYTGLAQGRMGIVAPLTAVLAATVPIIFSAVTEGAPPVTRLGGFGLALGAVWLLSGAGRRDTTDLLELAYALMAGLGFALFFILIDQVNEVAIFWPLAVARLSSVAFLAVFIRTRGRWQAIPRRQLALVAVAGILDAVGNALFALAARYGRLDLAVVLSSLYPVATVLLAQLVLKERLGRLQWLGVLLAVLALPLVTL